MLPPQKSSKRLGVISDSNLCFHSHISELHLKLKRHCGIAAKVRHCVALNVLIRYYNWNIRSLLQHGHITYGSCSLNALSKSLRKQPKKSLVVFRSLDIMHAEPHVKNLFSDTRTSRNLRHSIDLHLVSPMASSKP